MYKKKIKELNEKSKVIETDKGRVEYIEKGEGFPILALHGGYGGFDQYFYLQDFAENGFRVICPSRPGYLRTPLESGKSYIEQVDLMAAFLEKLNIKEVGVYGISASGPIAIQFAVRHKERCKFLILESSVSRKYVMNPETSSKFIQTLFLTNFGSILIDLLSKYFPRSIIQSFLKSCGYYNKQELKEKINIILKDPQKLEFFRKLLSTMTPLSIRKKGLFNDLEEMKKLDDTWPLEEVEAPTLIIHGTKDAGRAI